MLQNLEIKKKLNSNAELTSQDNCYHYPVVESSRHFVRSTANTHTC